MLVSYWLHLTLPQSWLDSEVKLLCMFPFRSRYLIQTIQVIEGHPIDWYTTFFLMAKVTSAFKKMLLLINFDSQWLKCGGLRQLGQPMSCSWPVHVVVWFINSQFRSYSLMRTWSTLALLSKITIFTTSLLCWLSWWDSQRMFGAGACDKLQLLDLFMRA